MSIYTEDDTDQELVAKRQLNREMLDEHRNCFNPLEGDVVIFPDGTHTRISHVWRDYTNDTDGKPDSIQTSHGGSFHWSASGYMSFSGGLMSSIPAATLSWDVAEYAQVPAWIFHHDHRGAGRGVDVTARVRVWRTTAPLPTI